MPTPTYKQQFDKITTAYIENKLDPYDGCRCFVGNMLNNDRSWEKFRIGEAWKGSGTFWENLQALTWFYDITNHFYSPDEIVTLENNFLGFIYNELLKLGCSPDFIMNNSPKKILEYRGDKEDIIFGAMESTLELLKQIHISKGEVIDDAPVFKKRILQLA